MYVDNDKSRFDSIGASARFPTNRESSSEYAGPRIVGSQYAHVESNFDAYDRDNVIFWNVQSNTGG